MKYFGYMPNDFINGQDVSVSLWTAGCPHRCAGCHNSHMWNYEDGYEVPTDIKGQIIKAISANGIERNFSILGGEPLAPYNRKFVADIVSVVRAAYPHIEIYLWTGYNFDELDKSDKSINYILKNVDYIIDGPFIQEQRDITLPLRGSSNQHILLKGFDF